MNMIEETLIRNLEKFDLIDKKLVIGFSGGGDSTSLIIALDKLRKLDYKLNFEAFHVNYGLRKDSDKDQKFVENKCDELNICLTIHNLKDQKLIPNSESEDNLRNIRYNIISSHIIKTKSYCLITAHNLNDHVETFLMKLTRGTGLKGMEGLKYFSIINKFNDLKIFRPFIEIYLLHFLKFNFYFLINLISISTIYIVFRIYGYSRLYLLIYLFSLRKKSSVMSFVMRRILSCQKFFF